MAGRSVRRALLAVVALAPGSGCAASHEVDPCELVAEPDDCCRAAGCIWFERHEGCFSASRECESDADCGGGWCADIRGYGYTSASQYCEGARSPTTADIGVCSY